MRKTEQETINQIPDPLPEPVRERCISEEQNKTRLITPNREVWTCNPQAQKQEQIDGSPITKPCANSEMSGTAYEQSTSGNIKFTEKERAAKQVSPPEAINAGPVPLYLIPQTLSAEIHAHGGSISEITVRRTGQHVYAISLTKTSKKGDTDAA